ncbi:hypothetical protein [Nonomuraea dietziae]|uniref:hypothetical protein n=1 Tax=Nonomuraea dietziae TaxID=65515 RepID=UPI0031D8A748
MTGRQLTVRLGRRGHGLGQGGQVHGIRGQARLGEGQMFGGLRHAAGGRLRVVAVASAVQQPPGVRADRGEGEGRACRRRRGAAADRPPSQAPATRSAMGRPGPGSAPRARAAMAASAGEG